MEARRRSAAAGGRRTGLRRHEAGMRREPRLCADAQGGTEACGITASRVAMIRLLREKYLREEDTEVK